MFKKFVFRSPIFLTITLTIMLLFSTIVTVNALSYYDYDLASSRTEENTQSMNLAHQSGKFVQIHYNETEFKIKIKILSSDGTLFGNLEHETAYPADVQANRVALKVFDLDSDEFLIFEAISYSDNKIANFYVYRYNINTLTKETDKYVAFTQAVYGVMAFSSIDAIWYDGDIYAFISIQHAITGSEQRLVCRKYDPVAKTFIVRAEATLDGETGSTPLPFLKATPYGANLNQIMVCTAYKPSETTPRFWLYDVETNTWEYQAQFGISGRYVISEKFWWIDAGFRTLGNDVYFYFTWANTVLDAGVNTIHLVQHRLIYNITLEQSELQSQNTRTIILVPTITDPSPVSEIWTMGYCDDVNATDYRLFHEIQTYDNVLEIWVSELWELSASIPDWFNTGISTFSQNTYQTSDEDIYSYPRTSPTDRDASVYDVLWSDFQSQWQTANKQQNPSMRIWNGILPLQGDYDITFIVTPDESPKVVNRNYRMTITTLNNDIAFRTTVILYFDGSQVSASATEINGQKVITFLFGTEGLHTITVKMYQYTTANFLYEESYEDVWSLTGSEPDEPTADLLIPLTVAGISIFMPIFFIVLVPTFALGEMAGKVGVMAGLIIGVTIGAVSGLLPMYTVFLLILVIVMAFVFLIRGGRF